LKPIPDSTFVTAQVDCYFIKIVYEVQLIHLFYIIQQVVVLLVTSKKFCSLKGWLVNVKHDGKSMGSHKRNRTQIREKFINFDKMVGYAI